MQKYKNQTKGLDMVSLVLFVGLIIFLLMVCAFSIAYIKSDNTVADLAWGLGFIVVAWASFIKAGTYQPLGYVVCSLVTLWGVRLFIHINLRNKGRGEDPRYKEMRLRWGAAAFVHSFFKVFMLQGFLLLVIAYEVIVINNNPYAPFSFLAVLGVALWIVGFLFESIGDYQLYTFMKDPSNKGKIMMSGLWQYTRHPNYFGEICMWWGIYALAYMAPFGLSALISPCAITFLLLFVSGIPMTEKMFADNPAFNEYKKRTSVLIPWFPKK